MNKTSPVIKQYLKIKSKNLNKLLFFRMGDFYELFFEDAKKISKLLGIVLTKRGKLNGKSIPMAGVPYHSVNLHLLKLIKLGESVVICEQFPKKENKKIFERKVVKILTPGTLTDDFLLEGKSENFIISVYIGKNDIGISYISLSSGIFKTFKVKNILSLKNEISRISPSELIVNKKFKKNIFSNIPIKKMSSKYFDFKKSKKMLSKFIKINNKNLVDKKYSSCIFSSGCLLQYILYTQKKIPSYIKKLDFEDINGNISIDFKTRNDLEINKPINNENGISLFKLIDNTSTLMGSRLLKKWINNPIRNKKKLWKRQFAIYQVLKDRIYIKLKLILKKVPDIERSLTRIALYKIFPPDLIKIKETLSIIPKIKCILKNIIKNSFLNTHLHIKNKNFLKKIYISIIEFPTLLNILKRAIIKNPPSYIKYGEVIADGYNKDLDNLRNKKDYIYQELNRIEKNEIEKTKISKLKIKFNKIDGYFIEISSKKSKFVPSYYIRKKTLKNCERFTTYELISFEKEILGNKEFALLKEKEIYMDILKKINFKMKNLKDLSNSISKLDVILNFAECSEKFNMTCPIFSEKSIIYIKGGRHIIVEYQNDRFIKNDTYFSKKIKFLLTTGPNMGGKSTYMRQIAIIVLLAYSGSFVPAEFSLIGPIDKIFTRIGSSDNITSGYSTFMVEMLEISNIINQSSKKSLILIDEIGRGTSTNDGIAIAYSIIKYLSDLGCFCLFSTHYLELTNIENEIKSLRNIYLDFIKDNGNIIYLYKKKYGISKGSFGIQVAKLSKIPLRIIELAKKKIKNMKIKEKEVSKIKLINLDSISPYEAQNYLYNLKKIILLP